ncbi:MAG: response regulator [Bdellovibrio sp.]
MPLKILVVEDNLDWELIWKQIFDVFDKDSEIHWATSADEAHRQIDQLRLRGIRFDIVVSDIFLLGSSTGLDLLESLDSVYEDRFLFVSSVNGGKLRENLKERGIEARVLQKPFGMQEALRELQLLRDRNNRSNLAGGGDTLPLTSES